MGSVAILTTSGDNDPPIEPVQSFRHYLYCDACGSFDLGLWESAERASIERHRARLASLALYASPLVVVPVWRTTVPVFPLSWLFLVAMGIGIQRVLKSLPFKALRSSGWVRASWRFALGAGLWFGLVALAEGLSQLLPAGWVALLGGLLVAGALGWRAALSARIETLGLRCRQCAATYGNGTPFFADLDANPRGLTEADVPLPLWRLQHREGRYVGPAHAEPPSRLPL